MIDAGKKCANCQYVTDFEKLYWKKNFTNFVRSDNLCSNAGKRFQYLHLGKGKVIIMIQRKIKLNLDEVKDFVAAASKCDFDIDVFYNRYRVDAKSIVGVLGLDLRQVLTVSYDGYDPEFERVMARLALAS